MSRMVCFCLFACLLGLQGCSGDAASPTEPGAEGDAVTKSGEHWREERMMLGRRTYETACADCHDSGKMDAPLIGNPKDWSGRSELWEAVLFEHAKSGYLEMPEKGGHTELSDEAIEAAAEYMLMATFPEQPSD